MTFDEFYNFLEQQCMHEAIYTDSEGRDILVIRVLDAYAMLNKATNQQRNQHVDDR